MSTYCVPGTLRKSFLVRTNSGVCKGPGVERMKRKGVEEHDGKENWGLTTWTLVPCEGLNSPLGSQGITDSFEQQNDMRRKLRAGPSPSKAAPVLGHFLICGCLLPAG